MAWRVVVSFLLILGIVDRAGAQQPQPRSSENVRSMHFFGAMRSLNFETDAEAQAVVAKILTHYGLTSDYEIRVSDDGVIYPNAAAIYNHTTNKRQVVFNRAFMVQMKATGGDWALYGIAAHEVGHHIGLHLERPGTVALKAELEADYYAGFTLGKMGASYDQSIAAIRYLPGPQGGTSSHPPRDLRRDETGRGWKDATGKGIPVGEAAVSSAPTGSPKPVRVVTQQDPNILAKFDWKHNRDISGKDLAVTDGRPGIPGVSLHECAARCDREPRCKAFSFDRWNGWCFIKFDIVTSILDPPSILGVKKPGELPKVSTGPRIMQNYRKRIFRDAPYAESKEADFDACKGLCNNETQCVAFTFIKSNQSCRRFVVSEGYFSDPSADSGVKRQLPN